MENIISALILAVIQGITEWLPISSSGHLVLFEKILNYQGSLEFDVALHFGTLMAVFVYFGKDIIDIIKDFFSFKFKTENGKTGVLLIVATIPAALVGYFLKDYIELTFNNLIVTAIGFAITGIVLLIASLDLKQKKRNASYFDSFLIGCAQAISIIPGISRSGSTMSTGIILGLNQKTAARFAFLMAIPIILGANILSIGNKTIPTELFWATLISFMIGLASIHILYKFVLNAKKNLRYFSAYALILSAGIIIFFLIN